MLFLTLLFCINVINFVKIPNTMSWKTTPRYDRDSTVSYRILLTLTVVMLLALQKSHQWTTMIKETTIPAYQLGPFQVVKFDAWHAVKYNYFATHLYPTLFLLCCVWPSECFSNVGTGGWDGPRTNDTGQSKLLQLEITNVNYSYSNWAKG